MYRYPVWSLLVLTAVVGCRGPEDLDRPFDIERELTTPASIDRSTSFAEDVEFEARVIPKGGIFMRRSDTQEWHAPVREVDLLKEQLTGLQNQLQNLETTDAQKDTMLKEQLAGLQGHVQSLETTLNEDPIADKLRLIVEEAKQDMLAQTSYKTDLMIRMSKLDLTPEERADLKAAQFEYEKTQIAHQMAVQDFEDRRVIPQPVEADDVLAQLYPTTTPKVYKDYESNEKVSQIKLLKLEQKRKDAVSAFEGKIALLEAKQQAAELAKAETLAAERERTFMEELKYRKTLNDLRKQEVLADAEKRVAERETQRVYNEHRQEAQEKLRDQIAMLQGQISTMEEAEEKRLLEEEKRRLEMEASMESRLAEVEARYDLKIASLEQERDKLTDQLTVAFDEDAQKLKEDLAQVEEKLASVSEAQNNSAAEMTDYLAAIEDRVFAMEGTGKRMLSAGAVDVVNNEDIDSDAITVSSVEIIEGDDTASVAIVDGVNPGNWVELPRYHVVVHEDGRGLNDIMVDVLKRAEPYVGPWKIKWKLKKEHQDVLTEKFSLDAETTFESFVSYLSNYMQSYRGFGLTFNIFEAERVVVVTD